MLLAKQLGGLAGITAGIEQAEHRSTRARHAGEAAVWQGGERGLYLVYDGQKPGGGGLHVVAALLEALDQVRDGLIRANHRVGCGLMRLAGFQADFFENGWRR